MNRGLLVRMISIGLVALLLIVPLLMVGGLTQERKKARDSVVQEIARSAAYAQTITGPILVVPYLRRVTETQSEAGRAVLVTREVAGELRLLPRTFDLNGQLTTQERRRGIYRARIFDAATRITGSFDVPAQFGVGADLGSYQFGAPRLVLGISDIRGIGNALSVQANGAAAPVSPGTGTDLITAGVQAPVPLAATNATQTLEYAIELPLLGTGDFQVTPVGRESRVVISSDWPHPSFVGEFLPRQRTVSAAGFSAEWQASSFATNAEEKLSRCAGAERQPPCAEFSGLHFGVSFIDPVDQYVKSDRAVKYGFLFIALTFAGFFLLEVLRRFSVHPVQYGLVGFSLALFFLLLLSLSEHLGFGLAYVVSAVACAGLIGYYVSHVLDSAAIGAGFGAALAVLYALLYAILGSEDYALLTGSLLVFGVLAGVMVLTRRVDWYTVGKSAAAGAAVPARAGRE
jgi:inner membrane protein